MNQQRKWRLVSFPIVLLALIAAGVLVIQHFPRPKDDKGDKGGSGTSGALTSKPAPDADDEVGEEDPGALEMIKKLQCQPLISSPGFMKMLHSCSSTVCGIADVARYMEDQAKVVFSKFMSCYDKQSFMVTFLSCHASLSSPQGRSFVKKKVKEFRQKMRKTLKNQRSYDLYYLLISRASKVGDVVVNNKLSNKRLIEVTRMLFSDLKVKDERISRIKLIFSSKIDPVQVDACEQIEALGNVHHERPDSKTCNNDYICKRHRRLARRHAALWQAFRAIQSPRCTGKNKNKRAKAGLTICGNTCGREPEFLRLIQPLVNQSVTVVMLAIDRNKMKNLLSKDRQRQKSRHESQLEATQ